MPNYSGMWTLQAQMQAAGQGLWSITPFDGGTLWSWGNNDSGQLGQNDTINRSSPVQIGADENWVNISGQGNGVKYNGTLWSWGKNNVGQLGLNDRVYRSSPVQVGALTTWSKVSRYSDTTLATKTDGTLWSWGNNSDGQLGQNDRVYRSSPVQVGALADWSFVYAGDLMAVALKTDGTLWSWGSNGYGELGQNNIISRSSPVQVGALSNWTSVSAGRYFVLAIKTDGTLWAWGRNNSGQLGLSLSASSSSYRSSPVQVGALTTWSKLACGIDFAIAVKTDGTLWSWGNNNVGQLGQNIAYTVSRSSPVQVGSDTNWSKVAAGASSNSVGAIKTDGTLWSWGQNSGGQLGLNDVVKRSSPVQIGSANNWYEVITGTSSYAITS